MKRPLWKKTADGHWYSLQNCDLSQIDVVGVYMIWHGGAPGHPGHYVKVDHGNIAECLKRDRGDEAVLFHSAFGHLWVTWASVPSVHEQEQHVRHLRSRYVPLIGDSRLEARPLILRRQGQ